MYQPGKITKPEESMFFLLAQLLLEGHKCNSVQLVVFNCFVHCNLL